MLFVGGVIGATISCAQTTESDSRGIPETPAGHAFRAWLEAYDAADSTKLQTYARDYEPGMSVHSQLVFRRETGPWDVVSIARSDPRHLEVVLRSRADSTAGFSPLSMYAAVDVTGEPPVRATTTFALVGKGPRTQLRPISAAQRSSAIDSVVAKMVRNYVFLSVANETADSLRARQARGAYAGYETEVAFATRLNRDLLELTGDRQLGLEYAWRLPMPPPNPTPPAWIHCGLETPTMLDGGVGYLRLYGLGGRDWTCGGDVSAAMRSVAGARALVIDLTESDDESRSHLAFIASHFLAGCTHLGDVWDRRTGQTEELWTQDGVGGSAFGGIKPLYILTSRRTFAAAEELAYDLQTLGRATVVGERTAGAAHIASVGPVGDHLLVHVPIARAINPITRTNWQRIGVQPDVEVPASEALATAQRLIREGHTPRPPRATFASATSLRAGSTAVGLAVASHATESGITPNDSPRLLRGIRFDVDTLVPYAAWRAMLSRVAGVVEFADGRGRFDVTAVSRAPAVSVNGITIADPLARPGDYYLFDNRGFILVRPAAKTFSSFLFTRADFNHTGDLLPGAFRMGKSSATLTDTLPADAVAARLQHVPVNIQWHAQPRGGPPPGPPGPSARQESFSWHMLARGWLEVREAPAIEAGVARWFPVAAALATRPGGASGIEGDDLEVTSVALLGGSGETQVTFPEMLAPHRVANAEVDSRRLVLPGDYRETPWPGFERVRRMDVAADASAARWRSLEEVRSQRQRATCKQAWLPEGFGTPSTDAASSAQKSGVSRSPN